MSEETGGENVDLPDFSQQDQTAPAAPAEPPRPESEAAPAEPPRPESEAAANEPRTASDLEAVFDVPVSIAAVLGRTNMEVADLLKLEEGDVVELDRKVGEAIDIYVNNRLVARGEVVLVEDRLGVTMTEIIKGESN
ncbi:flagellar motor switch protein FliN [bacterium BMS3Bbin10]|nr:flagellar motor switch protein FliN [bacterium BMS3Bbin10]